MVNLSITDAAFQHGDVPQSLYTGSVLRTLALSATGTALAVGGYFYAGMWPQSQIFGRTLITGNNPNEIALTFDDGPNDGYTERLLEILAHHNAQATFFLIGRFARNRAPLVRQIRQAGHVVGNHTWTHPQLMFSSPVRIREELSATNAALEDILGERIEFFRPPHGARRPIVLRIARELGLAPVLWNVTVFDWKPIPPEGLLRKMQNGIARNQRRDRGSNLLLHDGGHTTIGVDRSRTIAATASLLELWQGKAQFVSVDHWKNQWSQNPTSETQVSV
ncbi:MAG: polysaccharide deacetylase family protein [Acidobacteriaceae bacterium]